MSNATKVRGNTQVKPTTFPNLFTSARKHLSADHKRKDQRGLSVLCVNFVFKLHFTKIILTRVQKPNSS